jgi:hypothetical protein
MLRVGLIFLSLLILSSCVSIEPPSMRSPCTAAPSDDPNVINPCIKRPVNTWIG